MFNNDESLKTIVISSTIESFTPITIGSSTFESCFALSEVTLTNGLKILAQNMFKNDGSVKTIIIPSTVTWIGRIL